ncbi:MAG TPA: PEP-CTERM sorting domain-containing protein [Chthoniobacteraceae bacterium]|jgi:hypothetical protein|nr:PEP-CTERM sorting domain-containing protein [Chthoniobacteraceae bacterium]
MKYDCSDSLAGKRTFLAIACSGLLLSAGDSTATVLNFDEISGSLYGTLYADDTYLNQGVRISSGSTPQAPLLLNDVFTLGDPRTDFYVYSNTEAVSGFNTVGATGQGGGNPNDILLTFTTPVSFVSLRTDHSVEQADIVQLVGLVPTGNPLEFRVTAVFSAADNALAAPFDTLSLSSGAGFTYVLFQQTTDLEAFDDLTYIPIPEPGVGGLLLVGGLAVWRRRR